MINPFQDEVDFKFPDGSFSPVWPGTSAAQMKIEVAVNAEGHVLVLHEKPFPDYLEWIEFDAQTGLMTFITAGGKLQELGLTIFPPMTKYVLKAQNVGVICVRGGEIRDMGLVPLTIHNYYEGGAS